MKYPSRFGRSLAVATLGVAFCLLAPPSSPALGDEEKSYPRLEGEVAIEVEDDWTFSSQDPDAELSDLFTVTEPALALYFTPELFLSTGLVLEPIEDPGPREDRAFEDHGFYPETLMINYETDRFSLYAGKFNPPFGVGWDVTPGIYGVDLAEDYELTERIGFGGALNLGNEAYGTHTVSLNTFFADTTILSESLFDSRPRVRRSDGGVSNTEDFSSFSGTIDGSEMPLLPGLSYHLGFSHQEAGAGGVEDEFGFAIGVYGAFDITDELAIEPVVEYAHFDGAEGEAQDRSYITVGAALLSGPWNLALAYSGRFTDPDDPAEGDVDAHMVQVSAGYAFASGVGVDLGYRFSEDDGSDSHTLGLLLSYAFEFAVPLRSK